MPNKPKRPADANQLAKLITDLAVGEAEDTTPDTKKAKAGARGGRARARATDPQRRREVAQKAAAARWVTKQSSE